MLTQVSVSSLSHSTCLNMNYKQQGCPILLLEIDHHTELRYSHNLTHLIQSFRIAFIAEMILKG